MQLLASDVVNGKVVMQVWRTPLAGQERDLVLAVSDRGKVATVWVAERTDLDGIKRQKLSRPERRAARLARELARQASGEPVSQAPTSAAPAPAAQVTAVAGRWRAPWAWLCRAIRDVLTHRRKNSCP